MKKIQVTEEQYAKIKDHMVESAILTEQSRSEVSDIQSRLNKCFNAGLGVDGVSGPKTRSAIKTYLGISI
jgi:peptidoglycan hydrolase-like protein with peptidoglycan-binding domain